MFRKTLVPETLDTAGNAKMVRPNASKNAVPHVANDRQSFVAVMGLLAGAAIIVIGVTFAVEVLTQRDAQKAAVAKSVKIRGNDSLTDVLDMKKLHVKNATAIDVKKERIVKNETHSVIDNTLPDVAQEPVAEETEEMSNSTEVRRRLNWCTDAKRLNKVKPGRSWGSLTRDDRQQWLDLNCDRLFCKRDPMSGRGNFACRPLPDSPYERN